MSELISREAAKAREVFAGSCSAAKEAIDYLEQLLLAALPPAQEAAPAVKVKPLLQAWEQWEGDIILNGDWSGETVRLTQGQHDRMIELQTDRNHILAALEGGEA